MSKAVRVNYCVPAASSASERAFSMGSLICSQRRGNLSPKRIEELAIIKLNYWAVQAYKDKYGGVPNVDIAPHHNDFELEEISDEEEEEEDQDDFNLELEELTDNEED